MARLGARTSSVFTGPKSALNNVSAADPDTRFAATAITPIWCISKAIVARMAGRIHHDPVVAEQAPRRAYNCAWRSPVASAAKHIGMMTNQLIESIER